MRSGVPFLTSVSPRPEADPSRGRSRSSAAHNRGVGSDLRLRPLGIEGEAQARAANAELGSSFVHWPGADEPWPARTRPLLRSGATSVPAAASRGALSRFHGHDPGPRSSPAHHSVAPGRRATSGPRGLCFSRAQEPGGPNANGTDAPVVVYSVLSAGLAAPTRAAVIVHRNVRLIPNACQAQGSLSLTLVAQPPSARPVW